MPVETRSLFNLIQTPTAIIYYKAVSIWRHEMGISREKSICTVQSMREKNKVFLNKIVAWKKQGLL